MHEPGRVDLVALGVPEHRRRRARQEGLFLVGEHQLAPLGLQRPRRIRREPERAHHRIDREGSVARREPIAPEPLLRRAPVAAPRAQPERVEQPPLRRVHRVVDRQRAPEVAHADPHVELDVAQPLGRVAQLAQPLDLRERRREIPALAQRLEAVDVGAPEAAAAGRRHRLLADAGVEARVDVGQERRARRRAASSV